MSVVAISSSNFQAVEQAPGTSAIDCPRCWRQMKVAMGTASRGAARRAGRSSKSGRAVGDSTDRRVVSFYLFNLRQARPLNRLARGRAFPAPASFDAQQDRT